MSDDMDYFVDTNTLWWLVSQKSKHHYKVEKFLLDLVQDDDRFFINTFVAIELLHLLIKQIGPSGKQFFDKLQEEHLLSILPVIGSKLLDNIWNVLTKYGIISSIGGRDASILVSMVEYNISTIITNDKDFANVKEISVLDPLS